MDSANLTVWALKLQGLTISSSSEAGFDFVDVDAEFEIVRDAGLGVRLFRLSVEGLIVMLVR